jgi:hypothetical protein
MVATAAPAAAAGTFVDDDGSVHEGFIEAVAAEGITTGCNPPVNDRYCPDDAVTRGQMAAFLVRALELTGSGSIDFVDDDESPFEDDIERLATAGVTTGCNPPTNDRFCPDDPSPVARWPPSWCAAFDLTTSGAVDFIDDEGSVFEDDIARLAAAGITQGMQPSHQRPLLP